MKLIWKNFVYESKEVLTEMPQMINSLDDNDDYQVKQMEKAFDETEEIDSQYKDGIDWSIREVPGGSRGCLYISNQMGEPIGYSKFSKAYFIPNAIIIQFTYLIEDSRGEGVMSTGYEYLLNHYGAIISDSQLTSDSMHLYLKLSKNHNSGIINYKTKEFTEMKFDTPEYHELEKQWNIQGTEKNYLLVIFKDAS